MSGDAGRKPTRRGSLALGLASAAMLWAAPLRAATPADLAFTVGNYPVEARAKDAVAAKEQAIAEGQRAAFQSLLKRLVPVATHPRLRRLTNIKASDYLDGVRVRQERNSTTEYIANLDFGFRPDSVRALLAREGLPYVEAQAAPIVIVPFWRPQATGGAASVIDEVRGAQAWSEAWKSLDLEHALTPAKLESPRKEIHADTVKKLAAGDTSVLRILTGEYKSERVVAVIMEPDGASKRLNVTVIGDDAVGNIVLRRAYRLDRADATYTIELAAVIALGVLEGRWKTVSQKRGPSDSSWSSAGAEARGSEPRGDDPAAATPGQVASNGDGVQLSVEFRGMGEWQDLSRRLGQVPGVQDIDVAGLSARSARIALRYPGGPEQLATAVGQQGLALRQVGGSWILSNP